MAFEIWNIIFWVFIFLSSDVIIFAGVKIIAHGAYHVEVFFILAAITYRSIALPK